LSYDRQADDLIKMFLFAIVILGIALAASLIKSGITIGAFGATLLSLVVFSGAFAFIVYLELELIKFWSVYLCLVFMSLIPVLNEAGVRELASGVAPIKALFYSDPGDFKYYAEARWYAQLKWQLFTGVVILSLEPIRALIFRIWDDGRVYR